MKFLNFLANTLPRTRKSKGEQKKKPSPLPLLAAAPGKEEILQEKTSATKPESLAFNKYLVTEDFSYLNNTQQKAGRNQTTVLNIENNINKDFDAKRDYVKQINCHSPTDYFEDDRLNLGLLPEHGRYNTVPRARSLIRTNPWLPSPLSSPLPSPMTSTTTSPTGSDITTRRMWEPNFPDRDVPMSVDSASTCDNRSYLSMEADSMDDSATLCNQDITSLDTDTNDNLNYEPYSDDDTEVKRRSVIEKLTGSYDPPSTLSSYEDIHGSDFDVRFEEGQTVIRPKKALESTSSFDYEQEFETILESVRSESNKLFGPDSGSRELSTDSSAPSQPMSPLSREERKMRRRSSCCDDWPTCYRRPDSPFGSERRPSYDTHSIVCSGSVCSSDMMTSLDSAYESSLSPTRSMVEIQGSIQDTMVKLEEGKVILDEFIREEWEDTRKANSQRLPELIKFQKQVTLFRKKLLLETLQDLKARLDDQGKRLQRAYTSVLNKQWERALHQQRKNKPKQESAYLIDSDGLRETIL